MSSIVVAGDTSGTITLDAPAVAGTTTLTLPTTSGTIVITSGAQTIEFADGSATAPSITNSGDTNTGMFFPAADTIAFAEGGTESMRLDSSGNVGIGTTTANPAGFGKGVNLDGTSNVGYQVSVGGTFTGFFGAYTSETRIGSISTFPMTFYTNSTERMRIDSSGNLLFNSGYGSVATAFGCRAWVNFNGTGTAAIRASGNVSSITDHGTGDYTVNYTTAMPDANYSYQCNGLWIFNDPNLYVSTVGPKPNNGGVNPVTASSMRIVCTETTAGINSPRDYIQVAVAIFR